MNTNILEVNLTAIKHNYQIITKYIENKKAAAVVKSDAYGLGVKEVSLALYQEGCRDFFIASIEEGIELREFFNSINYKDISIFMLNGLMDNMIDSCIKYDITPVCASWKQVKQCFEHQIAFLLHIETGLARLGVEIDEIMLDSNAKYLHNCKGLLSQLVFADEKDNKVSKDQYEKMLKLKQLYPNLIITACNSGGLSHDKKCFFDMIRIGRMLYGTCDTRFPQCSQIIPVIKWKIQIMQVRSVKAGEGVGYGHTFIAEKDMKVAILGVGYSDGLPIGASMRGAWCLHDTQQLFFIGRIGMDLCAISLPAESTLEEGDWIEFINENNTIDKMAAVLSLNPRFLITNIGNRVKRVYV